MIRPDMEVAEMRVIAFMNQKGGVGKTTTCANVGAALAEMGARVLMLDLDPQTNLTTWFGVDPANQPDLYDVLCNDDAFSSTLARVDENLTVAPGSKDLAAAEIELSGRTDRATVLRQKMLEGRLDYDYILFDCPPSLGLLTINALAVAGEVIVPMQPHFLALQGLARLLETVQGVNKQINPRLRVAGIVLTMFDANVRLSSEIVGELERFFDASKPQSVPWNEARVLKARVRRNIRLTECPSFGMSVLKYDSASNGAADYRALAREIATLRPVLSALAQQGTSMPAQRSLLDRVIDDAERQLVRPRPVSVTVNPALAATSGGSAREDGMRVETREVRA